MQEMQKTPVWSLCQESSLRRKRQATPVFLPGKSHEQRGSWATVLGIAKSQTRLSTHAQQEQAPGDLASVINGTTQFESLPFPEFLVVLRIRWLWPLNSPERQGALAASLITPLHRLSEPKVDWKEESRGLKGESVSVPVSMVCIYFWFGPSWQCLVARSGISRMLFEFTLCCIEWWDPSGLYYLFQT